MPPFNLEAIGRVLLFVGIGIAILGGLIMLASRIPGLDQLVNSGNIQIQLGENVSCFVPLLAMILISVVLTVIANIVIRFLNR